MASHVSDYDIIAILRQKLCEVLKPLFPLSHSVDYLDDSLRSWVVKNL